MAARLGYSTRQLERHLNEEVGAGPLAVARAQRAQTARLLIETTDLPFAQIAFGAGFASIRQFNDTVRAVFDGTPTTMRVKRAQARATDRRPARCRFRLPFRKPFAADGLFGRLVSTGVPGVEEFRDGAYRRSLRLPNGNCIAELDADARLRVVPADPRRHARPHHRHRAVPPPARSRRRPRGGRRRAVGRRSRSRRWCAKQPGTRIRRTVDEIETAVRVVLGQQVSLGAARTHAGRLVAACGSPIADPVGGLTHTFPTVESWRASTARR